MYKSSDFKRSIKIHGIFIINIFQDFHLNVKPLKIINGIKIITNIFKYSHCKYCVLI